MALFVADVFASVARKDQRHTMKAVEAGHDGTLVVIRRREQHARADQLELEPR